MLKVIASELMNAGFNAEVTKDGVKVFLKNRQVSKLEVQMVLWKVFEEIEFTLVRGNGYVIVR